MGAAASTGDHPAEALASYKGRKPFEALLPQPKEPKYKLAVVGFTAPGGAAMNTDKDKTGVRYDSTPIANGARARARDGDGASSARQ